MRTSYQTMVVSDLCERLESGNIKINRNYQRSDKVWPSTAQAFLIETIILDYPIPKLLMHQKIDLKTKQSYQEIVDGQQRSAAILSFYQNRFRLTGALACEELRGRRYDELSPEQQMQFMTYRLSYDLFTDATDEDIREVFRRINSYTVPLNPEEQRHAQYQGIFKWFIYKLCRDLDSALINLGVFNSKQISRMNDSKLFSEISHALLNGIETTNKTKLDRLYQLYDSGFDEEAEYIRLITNAVDALLRWVPLHGTPLMKPYSVYALVLAHIHLSRGGIGTLAEDYAVSTPGICDDDTAVRRLSALAEALDSDSEDVPENLSEFYAACSSRTNVKAQRAIRFRWFCEALSEGLGDNS